MLHNFVSILHAITLIFCSSAVFARPILQAINRLKHADPEDNYLSCLEFLDEISDSFRGELVEARQHQKAQGRSNIDIFWYTLRVLCQFFKTYLSYPYTRQILSCYISAQLVIRINSVPLIQSIQGVYQLLSRLFRSSLLLCQAIFGYSVMMAQVFWRSSFTRMVFYFARTIFYYARIFFYSGVALVCIVMGAFALFNAPLKHRRQLDFYAKAQPVVGTIVHLEKEQSLITSPTSGGQYVVTFDVMVEFKVEGTQYRRFQVNDRCSALDISFFRVCDYQLGKQVRVLYDPDDIQAARLDNNKRSTELGFDLFWGAILLLAGIAGMLSILIF